MTPAAQKQQNRITSTIQSHSRIAEMNLAEALDRLAQGVIITDRRSRPLFVNRTAAEIIAEADGLRLDAAGLGAADAEKTAIIRRVIAAAGNIDRGGAPAYIVTVPRPSSRRPFTVLVAPMSLAGDQTADDLPAAIVFISDPDRWPPISANLLQQLFGLTRAEAAVSIEVLRGEGLQAAAKKLRISSTTARTHLQRTFDKTGTRRQTELLLLIVESCGGLRFLDPATDLVNRTHPADKSKIPGNAL